MDLTNVSNAPSRALDSGMFVCLLKTVQLDKMENAHSANQAISSITLKLISSELVRNAWNFVWNAPLNKIANNAPPAIKFQPQLA